MELSGGKKRHITVIAAAAVFAALFLSSLYSYPLFHGLAELFSVAVAFAIFMLTWNSRRYFTNNYLQFLGVAYLFVGIADLLHTFAYKGMNLFQGYGSDLPTQLWIAGRYLQGVSLLAAPFVIGRKLNYRLLLASYFAVTVILLASVFTGVFPSCYIEGYGLTDFKIISEYIISLVLIASTMLLWRRRGHFEEGALKLIAGSILITIASELAFTFYSNVYGIFNLMGHYFKIIAFYLLYKAIVVTGLMKPYDSMFRSLKQSEEYLLRSKENISSILESINDGFFGLDNSLSVTYFNKAAEKLLSRKKEDILGRNLFEAFPEAGGSIFEEKYMQAVRDKKFTAFETYFGVTPYENWYDVRIYPYENGISVIFQVTTERKRAEEKLRKENREIALANRLLEVLGKEAGDDMFDKALNIVLEGMKSRHGVFGYIDERGHLICPSMTKLLDECEVEGKCIQYPPEKWKGLWSRALLEKRTLYTNEQPRVPAGHPIIHNNLAAPILFQDSVIGLFNLANKETGYIEEDREFIDAIASRIAPVLYAWIQKEMRENERKRVEEQIRRHAEELRMSNEELTRLNRAMEGRELRMIELKKEINELCGRAGLPPHYPLDFEKDKGKWNVF